MSPYTEKTIFLSSYNQNLLLLFWIDFALCRIVQDWWNSTSFTNYYRTWNVVVHDWLFYYGYRDFLWVSAVSL